MLEIYLSLFFPAYPRVLVKAWKKSGSIKAYLRWYWHANDFRDLDRKTSLTTADNIVSYFIYYGIFAQLFLSFYLIYEGFFNNLIGGAAFGLACFVIYPVVWAHLLIVLELIRSMIKAIMHPKKSGKALLCFLLEGQVRQLRATHKFKLIAVVGSVGKTSTKAAIAKVLGANARVLYQEGNYNDRLTVPLVIFDKKMPSIWNIFAWNDILAINRTMIREEYPYDYVIVELGTDGPGQIKEFAYLNPDLSVVTAVDFEHMQFFSGLDAVAKEELSVFDFSKQVLVNVDDTPAEYLKGKMYLSYGLHSRADYRVTSEPSSDLKVSSVTFKLGESPEMEVATNAIGKQGVSIALAAAATAKVLGINDADIKSGLKNIEPFPGRMQILSGIKDSTIIDDSYNASPKSVIAALDVLYTSSAPQRIAILGNMNELGDFSQEAHLKVGKYCDPKKLDYVVTIGLDANKYLAVAARAKGCKVESFDSPYAAGEFVRSIVKSKAVILADGSQNGVFAEESLRVLLANPKDSSKLVRQNPAWLKVKRQQFQDANI